MCTLYRGFGFLVFSQAIGIGRNWKHTSWNSKNLSYSKGQNNFKQTVELL